MEQSEDMAMGDFLVSIQGTIGLIQESVHSSKDHGHGELLGINKIQRLCHRNEDLRVDPPKDRPL